MTDDESRDKTEEDMGNVSERAAILSGVTLTPRIVSG